MTTTTSSIKRIPSFITPEECAAFIQVLIEAVSPETAESVWEYHPWGRVQIKSDKVALSSYRNNLFRQNDDRRTAIVVSHLYTHLQKGFRIVQDKIIQSLIVNYNLTLPIYPEFTVLQANRAGDVCPRHSDNSRYDKDSSMWVENHTPFHAYSACLYLNNSGHTSGSDYAGGELVFPEHNLTITPTAGLLVTFPSNEQFEHSVNIVMMGIRFAILIWFTHNESLAERLS